MANGNTDNYCRLGRSIAPFFQRVKSYFIQFITNQLPETGRIMPWLRLYLIGGTMGVGKTTISQQLKKDLPNSVFLDGDWCWAADPFQVTEETKEMVMRNICYLLNSFLRCTAYDNIIFCWVMHEQSIINRIIKELDASACRVIKISLITDEANLRNRLSSDIARGIRTSDVIDSMDTGIMFLLC